VLGIPERVLEFGTYKVLVYDHNISRDLFGTMRGPVKYLWGFQGKYVRNGYARVQIDIPLEMRGRDLDVRIGAAMRGETVRFFCGSRCVGGVSDTAGKQEESVVLATCRIPADATAGDSLVLRIVATGVKSPKERGWHDDKTKLGPKIVSAKVTAGRERERNR